MTPTPPPLPHDSRARRRAARLADEAERQHRLGALAEADRLYRQALALQPDQADSLHGLGVLALARGQSGQAIAFIGRAVAARPEVAHYYINLGLALLAQGHAEPARGALQVAVLRAPDDPRAHAGLAAALDALDRPDEAAGAAAAAIRHDPRHGTPQALASGASALLGRREAAAGRPEAAERHLRAAVAEAPMSAFASHALGACLGRLGRIEEAERAFRRTVELAPHDPAALANLGGLLFERHRLDEAQALLRRAVAIGPPSAPTLSNLGLVLMAQGQLPEADAALDEAAAMAPGEDAILVNRASILSDLGRFDAAEACLATVSGRAPAGSPDAERARFNRATVLLATGRRREGWAAFEARRALLPEAGRGLPPWDGSGIEAPGTLLLHAEQGLGDAIQFLRYVRPASLRARVVLALPGPLLALAGCLAGPRCEIVAAQAPPPPGCVAQASLLSLPHLLGEAGPPPPAPYLAAPPDGMAAARDWVRSFGPGLTVGLAWAGNPDYRFDRRRSLPLGALAPLAGIPGVRFVGLQQGEAAGQPAPPGLDLAWPAPPRDLADTAALVGTLDLVVSVDSAVAHLAGALGRPVWLLNRFGGDWRWQAGFEGPDGGSLWYPTLRQFRQAQWLPPEQAWSGPVRLLADTLREAARRSG